MTGPETEPFADRPAHPYIDQFTNEWAWRFEDGFNRLAAASPNAEDFQNRLAVMWEQLRHHKPEMASAWGRLLRPQVGRHPRRHPGRNRSPDRRRSRWPRHTTPRRDRSGEPAADRSGPDRTRTRHGARAAVDGVVVNVVARPLTGLAVCAGVGAIELGLRLVFGDRYRTVGYVERDAHAASALVARMADKALDPAPVWDDVTTFDSKPWRGRVDLVSAGFPCQPFSQAGQRRGTDDERWVWPDVARILGELGPRLCLLENVPGLIVSGLGPVLGDLADLGFDAEWDLFSAAEVGAGHLRRRVFILGWRRDLAEAMRQQMGTLGLPRSTAIVVADAGGPGLEQVAGGGNRGEAPDAGRAPVGDHQPCGPGQDVADCDRWGCALVGWEPGDDRDARADADGHGCPAMADATGQRPLRGRPHRGGRPDPARNGQRPSGIGEEVGDAPGARPQGSVQRSPQGWPGPGWSGAATPLFPPGPDHEAAWDRVWRTGGPEPAVCRMAHGLADRLDRLHAIGNGVVPLVAAVAFIRLAQRAGLLDEKAGR